MHPLHQRALFAAKRFREAEAELLSVLQEIDRERIFLGIGYSSLFQYAVQALGLSEANTSNFIAVARKAVEVPELKEAVADGRLTVAKARRLTPLISPENKNQWLALAETLPQRQLESEVARHKPEVLIRDRQKAICTGRTELKMGVSDFFLAKLRRAQDVVSQREKKAAGFELTLETALDFYLSRMDNARAPVDSTRKISMRRQVMIRDHHRCTFTAPDGNRCMATRWLDVHHIQPRAQGGTDELTNLITLCSNHHSYLHRQTSQSPDTV